MKDYLWDIEFKEELLYGLDDLSYEDEIILDELKKLEG